ncbi:MAG: response regulator [Anaerolineae bacterium]
MNERPLPHLVLIADDEVQTTVMLSRIFEREGYRVHNTHDGITALEAAAQLIPDLILLDVQMPGMNGFEVLEELRKNPLTEGIPTIIVTAKARQPADIAHGLNLGADDFVQKPFDPRELVARARSKIKARKLEETLYRRTRELEILLRVSDALSQHLAVSDLLSLVPYLALDLFPGTMTAIFQLDEHYRLVQYHLETKETIDLLAQHTIETFVERCLQSELPFLWKTQNDAQIDQFTNGIVVPLQHGDRLLGLLALFSNRNLAYDENHIRLLEGIGRQAALAFRNAELHEIQVNYASRLEEMVEEKTSELKSAQEMLIRAEKLAAIGELAASIAHEINNPLQPLKINLEHMVEDIQSNIPIDLRAVQSTQESVERIRRIVNQLLDFAGKRGTSESEFHLLDVSSIIEAMVNLNRKFFEKEGMRIEVSTPVALPVFGSKDQLEQVFINLILNAQAAMQRGGTLQIKGWIEQGEIITTFMDDGAGIAPEQINKIFDPFFSTKPNGTGLGLFVTYGIVQSHHGSIHVDSKVKHGTTFTVHLPAQEKE